MDEKRARRLLDDQLRSQGQSHATDEEWLEVRSFPSIEAMEFSPTAEEDIALEAANLVSFQRWTAASERRASPRRSAKRRSDGQAPEWWAMESRRRLEKFKEERVWMRIDAGLFDAAWMDLDQGMREDSGPYDVSEATRILSTNALLGLRVPPPDDALEGRDPYRPLNSVAEIGPLVRHLIRRQQEHFRLLEGPKWQVSPYIVPLEEHEAIIELPAESWTEDRRMERELFLPAGFAAVGEPGPSLDRLHLRSTWLAEALGIGQADCLVWGLTDLPFTIPWMPTTLLRVWDEWSIVTMQVNSMSSTAPEVARAYTAARRQSEGQSALGRAPRPWTAFMVTFVRARLREAPQESWDERFRAFASAHPDQPYKSMRTFRQAFYDQEKKRS
jgi:hypothetical protein